MHCYAETQVHWQMTLKVANQYNKNPKPNTKLQKKLKKIPHILQRKIHLCLYFKNIFLGTCRNNQTRLCTF